MELLTNIENIIKNNLEYFEFISNDDFSKIFNQFIYNYYTHNPDQPLENIYEIYNNIIYLYENFNMSFETIKRIKNENKKVFYWDDSLYTIFFKNESELYVDDILIESLNKVFGLNN